MKIIPSFALVAQVGAVALLVGGGLGTWGTAEFYGPRLDLAESKVSELSGALTRQNEAVGKLGDDTKKLQADLAEAQKQARARSTQRQTHAMEIMAIPLPTGVDQCTAASGLIRKELAK